MAGRDYLLLEDRLFQAAPDCWVVVGQGPGVVDMADLRMSEEAGIAAIGAGSRCSGEEASTQVAHHPTEAGERRGDCSDRGRELAQAQIGT